MLQLSYGLQASINNKRQLVIKGTIAEATYVTVDIPRLLITLQQRYSLPDSDLVKLAGLLGTTTVSFEEYEDELCSNLGQT